jgi:mono/diheme cytochrome c family protein
MVMIKRRSMRAGFALCSGFAACAGLLLACGDDSDGTRSPIEGSPATSCEAGSHGGKNKDASAPNDAGPVTGTDPGAAHIDDGQWIFRHDTFGDESFWTDTLHMNEVIAKAVDPTTALTAAGLKVDSEALPPGILDSADLKDPATTVALIKLGAVVGIEGTVDDKGNLVRVGVACALCHSNVDDSVMKGIGKRLDGHANRDLDPGLILSLSPHFANDAKAKSVLTSWGKGRYDARWNQDGMNEPVLIPPIYGIAGVVPLETYTGDGPVSYWNSYVAVTQMGGQGQFFDPRVNVVAIHQPDLVTPKLPALFEYQAKLKAPSPPDGSYDEDAAQRGKALFQGKAQCASCHGGSAYSDATDSRLHDASETGMDPKHAARSATGKYRTTPLRALFEHAPYFHDGSAASLADVVSHYDQTLSLGLSANEQSDLVAYLGSL